MAKTENESYREQHLVGTMIACTELAEELNLTLTSKKMLEALPVAIQEVKAISETQ